MKWPTLLLQDGLYMLIHHFKIRQAKCLVKEILQSHRKLKFKNSYLKAQENQPLLLLKAILE